MRLTRLRLENWKNFVAVDVPLRRRVFLVGPNAAGKSNLLDAVRFLRDIADPEGGFQRAVGTLRGGVSQIRSLHARRQPNVTVEVELELDEARWTYRLEFAQDNQRRPVVRREMVARGGRTVRERPDQQDDRDPSLLSQTHLEQVSANKEFRRIAEFFADIRYYHIVPQLVREPERSVGRSRDPFGGDFLEQIAGTTEKTRRARLRKIKDALRVAVPQLQDLQLVRDNRGVPHLQGLYQHWRPNAGWQTEEQLSDGTLRLLGLLWALLDGGAPLLLEEPELSLHSAVVQHLPTMMTRLARKSGRQMLVSTHAPELLSDRGIAAEEVLLLEPAHEGTKVRVAAEIGDVRALLEGGATIAEAVLARTAPPNAAQLSMFGD